MRKIIEVPGAPKISGLLFRGLGGPEDYHNMQKIILASSVEDDFEYSETAEDIAGYYSHLANCDPHKDILFAEVGGEAIGYSRVWYIRKTDDSGYLFEFFANLKPEWRRKGIREAMLAWCESRVRDIAISMPENTTKEFVHWVGEAEKEWREILEKNGYAVIRHGFTMVRKNLDDIPDCPLPPGIEVRPVLPDHYRKIWDADVLASQDSWLSLKAEDEWYQYWLTGRLFQPELWQVAWDGDRVAGAVQNWIDIEENAKYGLKRGWTENIHVGREWRGKGLAQALIARSFRVLRDRGMEEAALGVDAMNPTGALHLYTKMGFTVYKKSYTYSKKFE